MYYLCIMGRRKILVAPINWGLGHAARCIPLIKKLEEKGFTPILASDGGALALLKLEFPHLRHYELPSYNISYTRHGKLLKWKLLKDTPAILSTIRKEKKVTKEIVETENISGIISDSRFGVRCNHVPAAFVTHQLNVLSGNTTFLSSRLHRKYISKFDRCWVPDAPKSPNLSGLLGHLKKRPQGVEYLGVLSRFEKKELPQKYNFLVLLSGPEPQRTILEKILLKEFADTDRKMAFIRGVFDQPEIPAPKENIEIYNYLTGAELEKKLNQSALVISRSGYTTLLDLAKLEKKAFFIPTPGQFEQEYLAHRMMKLDRAPYCKQNEFNLEKLEAVKNFSGLRYPSYICDFSRLFGLFEGE